MCKLWTCDLHICTISYNFSLSIYKNLIGKQAEDPSLSRDGMNAVRFSNYFCTTL